MSGAVFAQRFPRLFHVADAAVEPLIRRHGLLSAEALCALFEVPEPRRSRLLGENRSRYETLEHPAHGRAVLRRQLMTDAALAPRLGPGLTCACWRRFINARVFFWVSRASATRLLAAEPDRSQIVLAVRTEALIETGLQVFASPVNGGAIDRARPERRRWREPALYRPIAEVAPAERVLEVAVPGPVPPGLIERSP